jgi:hypothetical protein
MFHIWHKSDRKPAYDCISFKIIFSKTITESDNGQGNQGKSHYGNIVGSHRRKRHMKSQEGFAGFSMKDFVWQPCVVWGRPADRAVAK